MKWAIETNGEGIYWWAAQTPVGELVVEYPDPMESMDWEARWYPHPSDIDGVLLCSARGEETCKVEAVKAMRKRAQQWARAFK